jgi:hypothetical protein
MAHVSDEVDVLAILAVRGFMSQDMSMDGSVRYQGYVAERICC